MYEVKYKIFSKSLQSPFYTLKDSAGNRLLFFRHKWADCKLTMNGEDLVKIDVMKYKPFVAALNFGFETTLNNILFSMPSSFKFKVKGNYYSNKLKEINWKWKYSNIWSIKFTLVDKKNNGKELAKIEEVVIDNGLYGSLTISYEVPSELHTLIIASACLAIKIIEYSLPFRTDTCKKEIFMGFYNNIPSL